MYYLGARTLATEASDDLLGIDHCKRKAHLRLRPFETSAYFTSITTYKKNKENSSFPLHFKVLSIKFYSPSVMADGPVFAGFEETSRCWSVHFFFAFHMSPSAANHV